MINVCFMLHRASLHGIEQGEIEPEAGRVADASVLENSGTIGI